jgi:hypothetical protein
LKLQVSVKCHCLVMCTASLYTTHSSEVMTVSAQKLKLPHNCIGVFQLHNLLWIFVLIKYILIKYQQSVVTTVRHKEHCDTRFDTVAYHHQCSLHESWFYICLADKIVNLLGFLVISSIYNMYF